MNKIIRLILILIFKNTIFTTVFAQPDSLIRFSDLSYHSDFEREAIENFVLHKRDTFNLFLAIDEKMTQKEASWRKDIYLSVFKDLEKKKIQSKKIKRKIKLSYSNVHSRFLKKYNDNEYFPVIFQTGTYNCVSASMLYAMIFDNLGIPYKVKASSNHVYLVANPGSNSIVIETTNPGFEQKIFTGEFKQQYVNYLRTSKLISESEYKNKSTEEIFEEKFKEVRDAKFDNLPGFQYYNKALTKLQNNEPEEALNLSQKAYFFFPDYQVKNLLHTSLLFQIEQCTFDKVSDIDYLAQFSRFENTDMNVVVGIFNNIIYHHLQYIDKEDFCDSLNTRLVSQLTNKNLIDEINFTYNLQMSYHFQNSDKVEKYVTKALAIKGNHRDANIIFENYLSKKLNRIYDAKALIDSMHQMKERYNYEPLSSIITNHEIVGYLRLASKSYNQNQIAQGDKYLLEFETNCTKPIENNELRLTIERTYRNIAYILYMNNYRTKAKSIKTRGLKLVPESELIKTAF
ncbi:MAG: hypothetical protein V2I54_07415 [Bacteroidales bacterium]|nr:hypothetical protein [Bacteroidales bacterium]